MKKRAMVVACGLLIASAAHAEVLGGVEFTPPAGWARSSPANNLQWTRPSNDNSTCWLLALRPIAVGAKPQDAWRALWHDGAVGNFGADAKAKPTDKSFAGGALRLLTSRGRVAGADVNVVLLAWHVQQQVTGFFAVCNSAAAGPELEQFFASMNPLPATSKAPPPSTGAVPPATPVPPVTTAPAPAPAQPNLFSKPGVSGVWMSVVAEMSGARINRETRYRVFFDNGQSLSALPLAGLADYNPANETGLTVGRYQVSGKVGNNQLSSSAASKEKLTSVSAKTMRVDGIEYHRCASVNGARIAGRYTSVTDPSVNMGEFEAGKQPMLQLNADGTFVDAGLFTSLLFATGDVRTDAGGTGTYVLRDFTLTLLYQGGRQRRVPFTLLLGEKPSQTPARFYIAGQPMVRLK